MWESGTAAVWGCAGVCGCVECKWKMKERKGDDGTKAPGAKRRVAGAMARALSIVRLILGLGAGTAA